VKKPFRKKVIASFMLGMLIAQCIPLTALGSTINLGLLKKRGKIVYFNQTKRINTTNTTNTANNTTTNIANDNNTSFLKNTFSTIKGIHTRHIEKSRLNSKYNLWERRAIGSNRFYKVGGYFQDYVIKPVKRGFQKVGISK
jgi:hypothetical protein